jgi:hypothetical protein
MKPAKNTNQAEMDFSGTTPIPHFDGDDYQPDRDHARLKTQLDIIRNAMTGAGPLTLEQISKQTGAPHASVSAQLRNLRKPRFGSFTVVRKHLGRGLYSYELIRPEKT